MTDESNPGTESQGAVLPKPAAPLAAAAAAPLAAVVVADLRLLIQSARERVAVSVNQELTLLYWRIGQRLRTETLREQRAAYGKQIVEDVATRLTAEFGSGFGRRNLFRMIQFAEQFPDEQIVSTLSAQLSWSHFLEILAIKEDLARKFYAEMGRLERWSVRTLRDRINGMLYERTALSRKPEETIRQEFSALTEAERSCRHGTCEDASRSHGAYFPKPSSRTKKTGVINRAGI